MNQFSQMGLGAVMFALVGGPLVGCKPTTYPVASADDLELDQSPSAQSGKSSGKAPSAREAAAARPKMNAQAAEAYQVGQRAFAAGDLKGAASQFERAISADPRAHQAHSALGSTYERQGDAQRAIAAHERALELLPDFEPSIAQITSVYLRQGRAAEAQSFLSRQQARAPNSAAVLACMAEVKSVQKDSVAAQTLAQEALKKDPDYRPAMVVLARDHYRSRRLDLALYTLTAILDGYGPENPPRDKNNAEARLVRALIYKEQLRRNQAISEFQRAVELRPDLVEARLNLAAYMLEAGNADGAVPLLEGALAFEPANPLIHLNLGDAYRLQGRAKDALVQLDWVTQAAPNQAETYYDIGLVYLFGKVDGVTPEQAIDRAITAFEQFSKLNPNPRPGAGDDAAELLGRAKNKKAVLEAMKESSAPEAVPEPAPTAADATTPGDESSVSAQPSAAPPPTGQPSAAQPSAPAPPPAPSQPKTGEGSF